jgi:glycolate oxidase iron-sulfur subunit
LDSPRGRIYLMKEMLEKGEPATAETVKHIDRCLSCLSCMTTCPSGVNYMHLVDQTRAHIETTYRRPFWERTIRNVLAAVMPRPAVFRLALVGARLTKPFGRILQSFGATRLAALTALVPHEMPRPSPLGRPGTYPAKGIRRGRVALLMGCVQSVLEPSINAATIRVLTRLGFEVVVSGEEACCGSLTLHMGKIEDAKARARRSIDQWINAEVDHIIITASGCGTTIKDYGHLFEHEQDYASKAAAISSTALDITQFLARISLPSGKMNLRVAYHSACSMQHGQKIKTEPQALLRAAGFDVVEVPEGHLCCGSAGTYNILQPELASQLKARKAVNIKSISPQCVATGNIGCITQLQDELGIPIVHTIELLDWALGGPKPERLSELTL